MIRQAEDAQEAIAALFSAAPPAGLAPGAREGLVKAMLADEEQGGGIGGRGLEYASV